MEFINNRKYNCEQGKDYMQLQIRDRQEETGHSAIYFPRR